MRLGAGLIGACILLGATPGVPTAPPPEYTFHMDITMHMHTFPWMRFGMSGTGEFRPGHAYLVHFTDAPWFFPKNERDTDLSVLEPSLWPGRYDVQEIGKRGDSTLYALRALDDPTLTGATATLGPGLANREVDLHYNDGTHIRMRVTCGIVDGFMLPQTLSSDIDEPHASFSADADFKDYNFVSPLPTQTP